jgi:hypothetical protein
MTSLNPSEGVWEGLELGSARPCGQPALLASLPEPQAGFGPSGNDQARESCRRCGFIAEACACDQPAIDRLFFKVMEMNDGTRKAA